MEEATSTQTTTPGESPRPTKRRFTESEELEDPVPESPSVTHIYAPRNTPDIPLIKVEVGGIYTSPPTSDATIQGFDHMEVSHGATINSTTMERDQFVAADGALRWDEIIYLEDSMLSQILRETEEGVGRDAYDGVL